MGNLEIKASNMQKGVYVLTSEGEVLAEITDDVTIVPSKDLFGYGGDKLSTFKPKSKSLKNSWIKVNEIALAEANNDHCYKILPYVAYMSGNIVWDNGRKIRTCEGFAKICGISRLTAIRMIKDLIEKDVIHKHTDNGIYYTFNPFIALRGPRAYIELYEEFQTSKWRYVNSRE